jgi:hypothetical protein
MKLFGIYGDYAGENAVDIFRTNSTASAKILQNIEVFLMNLSPKREIVERL